MIDETTGNIVSAVRAALLLLSAVMLFAVFVVWLNDGLDRTYLDDYVSGHCVPIVIGIWAGSVAAAVLVPPLIGRRLKRKATGVAEQARRLVR